MSLDEAGKSASAVLPQPPSTTSVRSQSPSSHAAASTLAALAQNSPPSTSKSPARSTSTPSRNLQSLYTSATSGSGSPLRKELDESTGAVASTSFASPGSSSAKLGKQRESATNRRKKANRACSHCQKAHLTCDDARPCTRCVKKGQASTCTDGVRKKAKYLLDDEELEELRRNKEAKKAAKLTIQHEQKPKQTPASILPVSTGEYKLDPYSGLSSVASQAVNTLVDHAASGSTPASSGHGPSPHQSGDLISSSKFDPSAPTDPLGPDSALAFDLNFDPSTHNFGSEATSLEYSILSSMLNDHILGGPGSGSDDMQNSPAVGVMDGWNITDALHHNNESTLDNASRTNLDQNVEGVLPGLVGMDPVGASFVGPATGDYGRLGSVIGPDGGSMHELPAENGFHALEVTSPKPTQMLGDSGLQQDTTDARTSSSATPFDLGTTSRRSVSKEPVTDINQAIASRRYARRQQDANWRARIAKTYRDNTAPFPYPKGYHFLIKYVTEKFQKAEALRIVRALAIFRPSLIALQMPLTEEDEIFVERALQRTILEFEKLISFSGTPTVVWRRTCEICVVGAEFCMLTQWSRDQLMGRRIYEFMDTDSTLDYWEKFALHAFENTSQSVMTTCTLVKPDGKLVPCAWSFTIKRDTFDLPSLIVGNFLPILS